MESNDYDLNFSSPFCLCSAYGNVCQYPPIGFLAFDKCRLDCGAENEVHLVSCFTFLVVGIWYYRGTVDS